MIKKRVILGKIESTYNTDPTPSAGTDDIRVAEFEVVNANLRMIDNPTVKNTFGALAPVYAGTLKEITIKVAIRGSGALGTAADWGPLMRACRVAETLNASTSVVYKPTSGAQESVTIYEYYDGKLGKYTGCVGDLEFTQTTGDFHYWTFKMLGHFVSETDVSLPTPTYDAGAPITAINGAFTWASYASSINSFTFSLGNVIATDPDYNASDGYGTLEVTDRKVVGSFDPKDVLVATHDYYAEFSAGTSLAIATTAIGPATGNKIALSLPAVTVTDIAPGDRDGVLTRNINFEAVESSGDDQFTITMT